MRQRIHVGGGRLVLAGKLVTALVALGVLYAGAVVLALALGAGPADVASVTGYRDAYDALAELDAGGLTAGERVGIGVGGLLLAAVLLRMAWAQVPRPELARTDLELTRDALGTVTVGPRAVERAAETAAAACATVLGARARLDGDELVVALRVRDPAALATSLTDAGTRVREAVEVHGLGPLGVRVVAARLDASARKGVI